MHTAHLSSTDPSLHPNLCTTASSRLNHHRRPHRVDGGVVTAKLPDDFSGCDVPQEDLAVAADRRKLRVVLGNGRVARLVAVAGVDLDRGAALVRVPEADSPVLFCYWCVLGVYSQWSLLSEAKLRLLGYKV